MSVIDNLPDKVKIGGFDFAIIKWTPIESMGRRSYGECSTTEQNIKIVKDFSSPMKAVDTFCHECLHAIYWVYNIHDDDKEERIVNTLSSGMIGLYRDNPWLLDWIKESLCDTSSSPSSASYSPGPQAAT